MHARPHWLLPLLLCLGCDIADPADGGDRRTDPWDDPEPIDCEEHPCAFGCPRAGLPGVCVPYDACFVPPAGAACRDEKDCGPNGTADCVAGLCEPRCDERACAQSCTAAEGCRCESGACSPIPCASDAACPDGRCVDGRCGAAPLVPVVGCAFVPSRLTLSRAGAAPFSLVLEGEGGALLDAPAELSVATRGGIAVRDGRVTGQRVGEGAVIATLGEVTCELPVEVVAPPAPDETLIFVVDEQDGTPLEGAIVRSATSTARTNAAGVARLPGAGLVGVELSHLSGYERFVVGVALPPQARLPLRRRAPAERPSAAFEAGAFPPSGLPSSQEFQAAAAGFALAPTLDGLSPGALLGSSRRTVWSPLGVEQKVVLSDAVGANAFAPTVDLLAPEARSCPAQRCTTPTIWSVAFPALAQLELRRPYPNLGPDWAFDLLRPGEGREVGLLLGLPVPDPRGVPSPLPPGQAASLQLHLRVPPLDVGGAPRWGAFVGALAELPGRGLVVRGLASAIDPERDDDLSDGLLSDPTEVACRGVALRVGPRPAGASGPWRLFAISAETNPTRAACTWDRPCVDGLTLVRSEGLDDGAIYAVGERFLRAPTAAPPDRGVTTVKYCADDPEATLLLARWEEAGSATTWLLPPGCGELELPGETGVHALADAGDGASLTLRSVALERAVDALFDPDGPGLDHALRGARAITTTRITAP